MQLKVLLLGAFAFAVNCGVSSAQSNISSIFCPSPEFIAPCVCYIPSYYLVCENIQDVEQLRTVAVNLEGVVNHFAKLWIVNSTLQYLPTELLEIVQVNSLHIENVTLHSLFRDPPTSLKMFELIRIRNVRLIRGVIWDVFSLMGNLKTIDIDSLPLPVLGQQFSQNVPHQLRELIFSNTRTKKFEIGVFEDFKDLKKVEMYRCKFEELHRGSFPVPFNVEKFNFAENRLKSIPADLFTNMPKLNDVILDGNQISTIPESSFGGNFNQLVRLLLRDNPLKCDCAMRWIVMRKPQFFEGTCAAPKIMHGKELKYLYYEQFNC